MKTLKTKIRNALTKRYLLVHLIAIEIALLIISLNPSFTQSVVSFGCLYLFVVTYNIVHWK